MEGFLRGIHKAASCHVFDFGYDHQGGHLYVEII